MKKAFTLIELMIVIGIIALITTITIPRFANINSDAKVASVQGNLATLRTSIEMYKVKNEDYPILQGIEDDLGEFSNVYSKNKLAATPSFDGGIETNDIYITRTNDGGWLYSSKSGEIFANLSDGTYTGDTSNEIWEGKFIFASNGIEIKLGSGVEIPHSLGVNTWKAVDSDLVDGWESDTGKIEFWKSGFLGVNAIEGDYFIELNGTGFDSIYQEVETKPGTILTWSLSHRGRSGVDTAEISIGSGADRVVLQEMESDNKEWTNYTGTYTVPIGETKTRVYLTPLTTTGSKSVGNFIDNFKITTMK